MDAFPDILRPDELFRRTYPGLAGWVRRLVSDDGIADEIASEAFARLLSRPQPIERPQGYLYMIAANLVRDHWRKSERERRAFRKATAGVTGEPVTYPARDTELSALVTALPPRLREPVLLHYYAGYGTREVAALLGRPEGTIKADLSKARTQLKTALRDNAA
jgi:RNA polymerase sigma-70 factor (ECF subfamily)